MSYPVSRREQVLSIPPLAPSTFPLGGVDFIYFHTVPDGVAVKLNGESESSFLQGETHQGEPGSAAIQSVTFINQTAGALAVRIVFGLGRMTVAGVATLSGAIPLPSGASTAALQTSVGAAQATAAKQDIANTHLSTLATVGTRTGRLINVPVNTLWQLINCKRVAIINNGAVGNVTVTIAGNSGTLGPGYGIELSVDGPLETLAQIDVSTSASSTCLILKTT